MRTFRGSSFKFVLVLVPFLVGTTGCRHKPKLPFTSDVREAILHNNLATLKTLIDAGVDLNSVNRDRETPLTVAAERSEPETVKMLLSEGADPNMPDGRKRLPLQVAADAGNADAVSALLDEKAKVDLATEGGMTPLMLALDSHHYDTAMRLLKAGANPNAASQKGLSPLAFASNAYLTRSEDQRRVSEAIKLLLEMGADAKSRSAGIALLSCAQARNVECVQLLVERGAKLKLGEGGHEIVDAAGAGDAKLVEALAVAGADVNTQLPGGNRTALLSGAMFCRADVIKTLLAHGANPRLTNDSNVTPLDIADRRAQQEFSTNTYYAAHGVRTQTDCSETADLLRSAK